MNKITIEVARELFERNGIKTLAESKNQLWIRQVDAWNKLDFSWLKKLTSENNFERRKRPEEITDQIKRPYHLFLRKYLAIHIFKSFRTIQSVDSKTNLGFAIKTVFLKKRTSCSLENKKHIWQRKN